MFEPVGHPGDAVRFDEHGLGELPDRQSKPAGGSKRKQDLVLLRGQADACGVQFGEMGERPQLGAHQREGAIILVPDRRYLRLCLRQAGGLDSAARAQRAALAQGRREHESEQNQKHRAAE